MPLIIAAGGNGACSSCWYRVNGIDGLSVDGARANGGFSRNDYGGYVSNGQAGRGASYKNDFDVFKSYVDNKLDHDYNQCIIF